MKYGLYEWTNFRPAHKPSRMSDRLGDLIPDCGGLEWVVVTSGPSATRRGGSLVVVRASSDRAKAAWLTSRSAS